MEDNKKNIFESSSKITLLEEGNRRTQYQQWAERDMLAKRRFAGFRVILEELVRAHRSLGNKTQYGLYIHPDAQSIYVEKKRNTRVFLGAAFRICSRKTYSQDPNQIYKADDFFDNFSLKSKYKDKFDGGCLQFSFSSYAFSLRLH